MLPLALLKTAQGHPVVRRCSMNRIGYQESGDAGTDARRRDAFPPQLIELKSGETYNGHLVLCDTWMNIHLREVICTSKVRHGLAAYAAVGFWLDSYANAWCPPQFGIRCLAPLHVVLLTVPRTPAQDGDKFWRMPEVYVRGNTIKYLRVPDEVSRGFVCARACCCRWVLIC
jgi:U6 snRNA-associated Sm-like protein LSm4